MPGILDEFLVRSILTSEHRELIKLNRGLTDDTINLAQFRSAREENADIIHSLVKLDYEGCVRHGLIREVGSSFKIWDKIVTNNVIIPYFDATGECVLLRPHKWQPLNVPLQVYFTRKQYEPDKVCVLTEGEFKAHASEQLGFQSAGAPGISSFVATELKEKEIANGETVPKFGKFCEALKERGISNICIVFDNHNKADPKYSGYKEDAIKRYDPQFYAYRLAKQLNGVDGFHATIGWLPDEWRDEDGKADIDGMLANGAKQSHFMEVINNAMEPDSFIDSREGEERSILESKIAHSKHVTRKRKPSGEKFVTENNGRYTYTGQDGGVKIASNFTMEYVCTYLDDLEQYTHEFLLANTEGYKNSVILEGKHFSDTKKFRSAISSRGKFIWSAKDFVLDALFAQVLPLKLRLVRLLSFIGWDENEECFFFDNCAVTADGVVIEYPTDGIVEINGNFYRMLKQGDRPELHFSDSGGGWTLDALRELHVRMRKNFKSKDGVETHGVTIAFAWFLACALKPWLFKINRTFPILFVFGQKNSGKTRLMQWLMHIFFSERTDTIIGQNSAAFIRNQAAQLSYLPFWLEEFRNDQESQKHLSILRGIYDHSSAGISANRVGANKVFYLKSALAISGEAEPSDDTGALNQRIQLVELPPEISGSEFNWIEDNQRTFSGIFVFLLKNRNKFIAQIQAQYEQILETYRKTHKLSSRTAINYALIHATAKVILGISPEDSGSEKDFDAIREDERADDIIANFLRSCIAGYTGGATIDLKSYMDVRKAKDTGDLVLVFNLERCLDYYSEIRSRQRLNPINRRSMRKLLLQKKWVDKITPTIRVGTKVSRMYVIRIANAPEDVVLGAYSIANEETKRTMLNTFGGDQGPLADVSEEENPSKNFA